jgi:hypothetical protein
MEVRDELEAPQMSLSNMFVSADLLEMEDLECGKMSTGNSSLSCFGKHAVFTRVRFVTGNVCP